MPKFTITLFPEGDRVSVVDGPQKGKAGRVRAWQHIGPAAPDVVHMIELDKAKPEDETVEIEVPASLLVET